MANTNSSTAYRAAASIRGFWRRHPDSYKFFQPEVKVEPGTFIIRSNMVDGWPPKR